MQSSTRRSRRPGPWLLSLAALLLIGALPHPGHANDFDDGIISEVVYPDWFSATDFLDLEGDLSDALDDGKQGLMLFFSTQGCSYCHRFIQTSLSDPAIVERLRAHFDVLGLEIFSDEELTAPDGEAMPVKEFALRAGVQFAPSLLFYGRNGALLLRITGYYEPARFKRVLDYLLAGAYAEESFKSWERARLAAAQKPRAPLPLLHNPLFSPPPHALDRSRFPAARPLLVIFEEPGCERCPRFHEEVLRDREVIGRLAEFDVVRLDAADATTPVLRPDGSRSSGAHWAGELGFSQYPALVFVDERGGQILATDALVLKSRMMNQLGLVADKVYGRGWTYQRYARSKGLERAAAARAD